MKVKVEFFATLRDKIATNSLELETVGSVNEVINALVERFGEAFRDVVMEGGRVRDMVKVLVNGKDIRELKGMETELRDGDCISIFPPVAGG
ncbi:MAG: ubiquitin-like small modifier protein 1 [Candidatus Methanomethylicaceae archaeon]